MDKAKTATFDAEDSATVLDRRFFIVISRDFYSCDFFAGNTVSSLEGNRARPYAVAKEIPFEFITTIGELLPFLILRAINLS